MRKLFTWINDFFFLDFYLDKQWSFRFKLMNFISGDTLRLHMACMRHNLNNALDHYQYSKECGYPVDEISMFWVKRAHKELSKEMKYYMKGNEMEVIK